MTQPIDYSKQASEMSLTEAMIFGSPAFIERQESQGQQQFIESTVLPVRENTKGAWAKLIELGAVKGSAVDDLFVNATLPPGWKKVATNHSLWSDLVDGRGLKRGSIFYKAAFYDRDAFINLSLNRFVLGRDYSDKRDENAIAFRVLDVGLDRVVRSLSPVYYAVQDGVWGAVKDNMFHFDVKGRYSEADFSKTTRFSGSQLTRDEFYKDHHHIKSCHEVINAAENLAKEGADLFFADIPTDDSQWDEEFDFPES